MNIRSANTYYAAANTQTFANQTGDRNHIGGLFIGGKGSVVVASKTTGFQCAGGEANLYLINQGNGAKIELGTGAAGYETFKVNGVDMAFKNIVLSAGHNSLINGSTDEDVIFSYGQNCEINLNGGSDYAFINGAGTKVNGSDSSEYISGVPAGLPNVAKLQQLTPFKFSETIYNAGANIVYKSIYA